MRSGSNKTSLTPPPFIEVSVPSQESVGGSDLSTIFLVDFESVWTDLYF